MAKLVVEGKQVNVHLKRNDNSNEIQVLSNKNDPKVVKALQAILPKVIQSGKSIQLSDILLPVKEWCEVW